MSLSIHLVTWNGEQYISHLFDSLRKQTTKDWKLHVLDNGSTDKTVARIRQEVQTLGVAHTIIERNTNSGFASGHNALFCERPASYTLIINQDMVLEPHCLERLMAYALDHRDVAVVVPRIMRWNAQTDERSDDVDAIGLRVFRSRRVVEQFASEQWTRLRQELNAPTDDLPVFGPSGAAALFRRNALDRVMLPGSQVFDEAYGSYKEDVDLAFRLARADLKTMALLSAVIYHDRSSGAQKTLKDSDAAKNKKTQPQHVRYQSYKNHLLTLFKNEYWQNVILDFPWIAWYELKKFLWLLIFDRSVLRGWCDVYQLRKHVNKTRVHIRAQSVCAWKEMRRHWRTAYERH